MVGRPSRHALDGRPNHSKICGGRSARTKERQERRKIVSQPVSRFTHPFDVARHPTLEPEVKRAILARWASDAAAVPDQPALRHPADIEQPVPVDDVLDALRALDGDMPEATRH
jgi:hypothetical protein